MTKALHLSFGAQGEQLAVDYLSHHGYEIIDRNVTLGGVEIDIVARQNRTIILVEVKTRRSDYFGPPEEAVGPAKLRRLGLAALTYQRQNPTNQQIRLDVISIVWPNNSGSRRRLRHFQGVGEGAELVNF
jgi:putative endonuclease